MNYGVCTVGDKLVVGTPLTLCTGDAASGNVALDVAKIGTYHFVFRVVDKDSPTLTAQGLHHAAQSPRPGIAAPARRSGRAGQSGRKYRYWSHGP